MASKLPYRYLSQHCLFWFCALLQQTTSGMLWSGLFVDTCTGLPSLASRATLFDHWHWRSGHRFWTKRLSCGEHWMTQLLLHMFAYWHYEMVSWDQLSFGLRRWTRCHSPDDKSKIDRLHVVPAAYTHWPHTITLWQVTLVCEEMLCHVEAVEFTEDNSSPGEWAALMYLVFRVLWSKKMIFLIKTIWNMCQICGHKLKK